MRELRPTLVLFFVFTLFCGGIYPAVVTGITTLCFPRQAAGSLTTDHQGRTVGSKLIGQNFSDAKYFWPRPSATADFPYNPMASQGSNAGPTNPEFINTVGERSKAWRNAGIAGPIPTELVFASASGLDPHISPAAARLQAARVAAARGISIDKVNEIVTSHTEDRQWGLLGAPRVNVLLLNLALDSRAP